MVQTLYENNMIDRCREQLFKAEDMYRKNSFLITSYMTDVQVPGNKTKKLPKH